MREPQLNSEYYQLNPTYAINENNKLQMKKVKNVFIIANLISLIFYIGCQTYDQNNAKCFTKSIEYEKKERSVFYLENLANSKCIYIVNSGWSNFENTGRLYYAGNNVYVDLANEKKYCLFTSIKDSIGTKRNIKILTMNTYNDKIIPEYHEIKLIGKYKTNNENYLVIKIKNFVPAIDKEIGIMDAVVFFSDHHGFIGSYLSPIKDTSVLLEKNGNILENLIDYSKIRFGRIL